MRYEINMIHPYFFLLVLLFSILCPTVVYSAPNSSSTPITIGAVVSLSGPAAEQGKNWLEGTQLAVKELSQQGIKTKLIIEDDQTNPAKVHAAFEKLVMHDKVQGIIGGTWDFLAEAASPLSLRHKIPFITPTNPIEILSKETKSNPWFFTTGLSMRATRDALQEVLRSLKPERAALIAPNVPFGVIHSDLIEELAPSLGIEIIERVDFEYEGYQSTLRTLAARLANKTPDLIFCLTDYAALEMFWKEVRRLKANPWLLTTQHLDEAVKLSGTPSLWEKAIGIYPKVESKSFASRFEAEYGHTPKVYAAEGYDAALFLIKALNDKVQLSTEPYTTQGATGRLHGGKGKTDIATTVATALRASESGTLRPFH